LECLCTQLRAPNSKSLTHQSPVLTIVRSPHFKTALAAKCFFVVFALLTFHRLKN
jgi:hypothetical protein